MSAATAEIRKLVASHMEARIAADRELLVRIEEMLDAPAAPAQPAEKPIGEEEAAEHVRCSVGHLRNMRCTGDGPVFLKQGRRVSYMRSDLDQWLASCRRTSTTSAPGRSPK